MSSGRKPKPTYLKILEGNPGRRPLNVNEPLPDGDLSAPPDWMPAEQQRVWREAIEAAPEGLLKRLDASVFTVWVVACATHQDAAEKVARYGSVVKSPVLGQPIQSPFVGIMNRQAQIMLKAASEMGFSPSSRSRVQVAGRPKRDNKFEWLKDLPTDD